MDSHSSHLNAANRSRSSQTPSPSHSASATSSLPKRKLAATTAANAAASEDHAPPSTSLHPSSAVVDNDEDKSAPEPDQDSSIRTFTADSISLSLRRSLGISRRSSAGGSSIAGLTLREKRL